MYSILLEKYNQIREAQGHHSIVIDYPGDPTKLIKRPLTGKVFTEEEYLKLKFMKDNNSSNIFATVYSLTSREAVTQKLDLKYNRDILKWVSRILVTDHESDTIGKYGGESRHDFDAVSKYTMNDVLSPKAKNIKEIIEYYRKYCNTPLQKFIADLLLDYRNRIDTVTNWPVTRFDLHNDNIGLDPTTNQLKVFDF